MSYTYDEMIVSDLYKEVNGVRPSQYWWSAWMTYTENKKQATWDALIIQNDSNIKSENTKKDYALGIFGDMITKNIALGAIDKITAIRWILQSENISKFDLAYGPDYVSYLFGMGYDNIFKNDIQSAINTIKLPDFSLED